MYPLRGLSWVAGVRVAVLFKYMYLYKDSVVFLFKQISVWDLFQDGNLFFFRSAYSSESPPIGSKTYTQAVVRQSSKQFRKNNNKIFLNLSFVGPDICFLFFPFTDYSSTSFPQYIGTTCENERKKKEEKKQILCVSVKLKHHFSITLQYQFSVQCFFSKWHHRPSRTCNCT